MRVLGYIFQDIIRNRIVFIYTLLLAVLTWSAFNIEDNVSKGLLTALSIILLAVPLFSILFATIYVYNSSYFIELLLSQPIRRSAIWLSLFSGISVSLVAAFLLGSGIFILMYAEFSKAIMLVSAGVLISVIFGSLAFLGAIISKDKARGIGISLIIWLYFTLLFDGLVLLLIFQFSDYPIENIIVLITALSPVDLARILVLLHLEVSAMLGYTGALFRNVFGTTSGIILSFTVLILWIVIPFGISLYKFNRRDL